MNNIDSQLAYIRNCPDYALFVIDLFCGAGGETTGIEQACLNGKKCAKVIACVNHDENAIKSHSANHENVLHYIEDIRTLNLGDLERLIEVCRAVHSRSAILLHASLECTNFSRAKGGQARDADSRTLAEHLFRYIDALKPDYIQIENVREFMMWGDLDENGKPVSKDSGRLYLRWVGQVCDRGYSFSHRILNSADFGAYTSRERFFGIFAKKGLPIVFPEPTHCRRPEKEGIFGTLKSWKPVKEVLDLDDCGKSIFRDKPLSEKTLQRIYAGLVKFVAGGKETFMMRYNTVRPQDTVKSLDAPCGVLTTENRFALVKTQFLSKQFSGDPSGKNVGIDGPAGTVTTSPKLNLVSVKPWIMDTNYNNVGSSVDEPSRVVTANRKWFYLMNPQFGSEGASIDKPCFTLIARMDKKPPYIVTAETGPAIALYKEDSPMTVKIKEFMALYGIRDICMRMLKIPELKRIMGFPEDYVLVGTQSEQKKYIGNAVETHVACAMATALAAELNVA